MATGALPGRTWPTRRGPGPRRVPPPGRRPADDPFGPGAGGPRRAGPAPTPWTWLALEAATWPSDGAQPLAGEACRSRCGLPGSRRNQVIPGPAHASRGNSTLPPRETPAGGAAEAREPRRQAVLAGTASRTVGLPTRSNDPEPRRCSMSGAASSGRDRPRPGAMFVRAATVGALASCTCTNEQCGPRAGPWTRWVMLHGGGPLAAAWDVPTSRRNLSGVFAEMPSLTLVVDQPGFRSPDKPPVEGKLTSPSPRRASRACSNDLTASDRVHLVVNSLGGGHRGVPASPCVP